VAMDADILPSWRPGPTRDAVTGFLAAVRDVPVAERVALFDCDGTLWCERPSYVQLDFFLAELRARARVDPSLADDPTFAALLGGDRGQLAAIGLQAIGHALAGLFAGWTPEEFTASARAFLADAAHEELGRPLRTIAYQPMLELLDALRDLDFTIGIVTGGGTEFVRAVGHDLFGVPPELVVGTLIGYEFVRTEDGRPGLRRTASIVGVANEGAAKVPHVQAALGRRPILAAGNSGGDRELLEWACTGDRPGLALLVDHDDAEREYAYTGRAATFTEAEPITTVAARLGWTTISMADDWATVFPPAG
jgi:hypothetical protein